MREGRREFRAMCRLATPAILTVAMLLLAIVVPGCGGSDDDGGGGDPADLSADAVATIEGAPEEMATITKEDLQKRVEKYSAIQQSDTKRGKAPLSAAEEQSLDELIDTAWVHGDAEELGVTVTPKEIAEGIDELKLNVSEGPSQYATLTKEFKLSQEDVEAKLELEALRAKLQERAEDSASAPSESEIEDYYSEGRETEFTKKGTRDIRIVLSDDKGDAEAAKAMLVKDNSPAVWAEAATKYSDDKVTRKDGGFFKGLEEGSAVEPLGAAIFEAPLGQVEGPVKSEMGYAVFEVVHSTPGKTKPLPKVEGEIETTLTKRMREEANEKALEEYEAEWKERTTCAPKYVIGRCANSR